MDKSKFTEKAPGRLVPVALPASDWAFVPNALPTDWEFAAKLWPLLVDAKEALGTLNGIGQTLSDPSLLLRPLQNREAITSSKIEGTYVTPEQLLLYELDPREPAHEDERTADWMEVFNYSQALTKGLDLLAALPICNRVVLEIHKSLMQSRRGQSSAPGTYRILQVQIGSGGRFVPPPPAEVVPLMDDLEKYINTPSPLDPLIRCFMVHYQFEAIHPFRDGNGRVGRVLLALMIYRWLGHSMPWLYLSAFFEKYRDEYIDNLYKVSTAGAWDGWIEFCLRGTIAQARDSIMRCHKFHALKQKFHEQISSPTLRSHQIIDSLFRSPVVTVMSIANKFNVTYPTARTDIDRLCAAGILSQAPDLQPMTFYAQEIIDAAYLETD